MYQRSIIILIIICIITSSLFCVSVFLKQNKNSALISTNDKLWKRHMLYRVVVTLILKMWEMCQGNPVEIVVKYSISIAKGNSTRPTFFVMVQIVWETRYDISVLDTNSGRQCFNVHILRQRAKNSVLCYFLFS